MSSARADAQSSLYRTRTPSTDVSDNTSATGIQVYSITGGSQEAPIDPEEILKMRMTLNSMGHEHIITDEPLTNEQILANIVCA